MRRPSGLVLMPLFLATLGCGEDAIDPQTGGEGGGDTGFTILITDDPANDPAAGPTLVSPQAISGTMIGSIRVALRNDAGALVNLGVAQDVEIPLQLGADSVALADLERPPADDYVGIQLRFEGVSVTVDAGSEVGDSTLTADAVMGIGTGGLATVEIATPTFGVDSETDMDVVVDLNSELWITLANLDNAFVPQTTLANNVTVEIP